MSITVETEGDQVATFDQAQAEALDALRRCEVFLCVTGYLDDEGLLHLKARTHSLRDKKSHRALLRQVKRFAVESIELYDSED